MQAIGCKFMDWKEIMVVTEKGLLISVAPKSEGRMPDPTPGIDVEVVLEFDSASGGSRMLTNTSIHISTGQVTAERTGGSDAGFGFESFNSFYYRLSVDNDREHEGSILDFGSELAATCDAAARDSSYSVFVVDDSEIGSLPPAQGRN